MMTDDERRAVADGLAELWFGPTKAQRKNGQVPNNATEALARVLHSISLADALAKRVAALEEKPELKHAGIWREGRSYKLASLCTHRGGLWLATKGTKAKPGESSAWQLIVKSGRAT